MDPVHATAGSYGSQRVEETQESRDVASASTEQVEKGTSLGFRKFREALMAKKFKNQDNLPVAIEAVAGLYIGSYGAATNLQALQQAGITHVLCVSQRLSLNFPSLFKYLQLQVADQVSESISTVFDKAFGFIDSAINVGGKVLVHCFMGRSRSATIILAYLMARYNLTLTSALQELRRVRPQAQPNSGFYNELLIFEGKQKRLRE